MAHGGRGPPLPTALATAGLPMPPARSPLSARTPSSGGGGGGGSGAWGAAWGSGSAGGAGWGASGGVGMERLPPELFLRVLLFVDVATLARVPRVCRQWCALAADNWLWHMVRPYTSNSNTHTHSYTTTHTHTLSLSFSECVPARVSAPLTHAACLSVWQKYMHARWALPAAPPVPASAGLWRRLYLDQARTQRNWQTGHADYRGVQTSSVRLRVRARVRVSVLEWLRRRRRERGSAV
jgi:hypothetical protein